MFNDDGFLTSPYIVRDQSSLEDLGSWLHDQHFDLDNVEHDRSNGTVRVSVLRTSHNTPWRRVKQGVFSDTYEVDLMRTDVTIRKVRKLEIKDDMEIGWYMFTSFSWDGSLLILDTAMALQLHFTVEALDLEARDIGFHGTTKITRGPFGIFGTSSGNITEP